MYKLVSKLKSLKLALKKWSKSDSINPKKNIQNLHISSHTFWKSFNQILLITISSRRNLLSNCSWKVGMVRKKNKLRRK